MSDRPRLTKDEFLLRFAMWIFFSTMAVLCAMIFVPIPEDNRPLANTIVGVLTTACIVTIITFYYGSSKSSSERSEMQTRKDGDAVPTIIDPPKEKEEK